MTFSVIIPVYNTKEYLPAAVASVLDQTLPDGEIILADDGSDDGSAALCDALAAAHPDTVRALHLDHGGAGRARNAAIDLARGEYLVFLDSDDTLESHMFERLTAEIEKTRADIYFFQIRRVSPDSAYVTAPAGPCGVPLCLADTPGMLLWGPEACGAVWRRVLVEKTGIRFGTYSVGEDLCFTRKMIAMAESIVLLPDVFYEYFQREGSSLHSDVGRNREVTDAMEDILAWYRANGLFDRYREELCALCVLHVLYYASWRILRVKAYDPALKELRRYVSRTFPGYGRDRYVRGFARSRRLAIRLLGLRLYLPLHWLYSR